MLDTEKVEVKIKCSKSGMFECDLPASIYMSKLNIRLKSEGYNTLPELTSILDNAFFNYNNQAEKKRIVVAIRFGVYGKYCEKPNGEYDSRVGTQNGNDRPFLVNGMYGSCEPSNLIGLSYKVLCEKTRCGLIQYYEVKKDKPYSYSGTFEECDGWYLAARVGEKPCTGRGSIILDYTPEMVENLEAIQLNFKKVAQFLLDLCTHDQLQLILSSNKLSLPQSTER